MSHATKTERRLNAKKLHLVLIYHLFYPTMCRLYCISEFIWENLKRENLCFSWAFTSWELNTTIYHCEHPFNHERQLFSFALHCYWWWEMGVARQQKMKKIAVISNWETRANNKTRNLSTEVLDFCLVKYSNGIFITIYGNMEGFSL